MQTCPLVLEAAAYSLRHMTIEEERAYRAHLQVCITCQLKVQEIAETLDLLPLTIPATAPPPGLKGKVLEQVAADARSAPGRTRRWVVPVSAAAAAIALAVGGYSLVRIQVLQERLASFERVAPLERTVRLQGTDSVPTANGRVVVAREGSGMRIALQAQGLPPLRPGETYQLWLIKDGQRRNGGVFVIDAAGCGGMATWLPEVAEFDALGITREPDALGQEPRGPKIMGSI